MKNLDEMTGGELAEWLHDTYIKIALLKGWEVQESTFVSFKDLPEKNKSVMLGLAQCIQLRMMKDKEGDKL